MRRVNEEVYYAEGPIVKVGRADMEFLKQAAQGTRRKRVRLCAHRGIEDQLHEMLIIHERSAYVRPHRHLGKAESFHLIEGRVDVVFFDEAGGIRDVAPMGGDSGLFYYRISDPQFHTLLIRSDYVVFHESTSGPFLREQTEFASWSPADDNERGQADFLRRVDAAIRTFVPHLPATDSPSVR
jgi:cupin fold WbuC family metalloprotein